MLLIKEKEFDFCRILFLTCFVEELEKTCLLVYSNTRKEDNGRTLRQ
jgi:hypothetical protein